MPIASFTEPLRPASLTISLRRSDRLRSLSLSTLFLIVCGCATVPEPACRPGETPAVTESIYFGTNKPGGIVTPEEWAAFVNEAVAPAFPEGLTSWPASGQWRMASGTIEREGSHVLQLTHDDSPQRNRSIQLIVATYKRDFHQEAVLRVRSRTCIQF